MTIDDWYDLPLYLLAFLIAVPFFLVGLKWFGRYILQPYLKFIDWCLEKS